MIILSKAKVEKIQKDIFENQAMTEKDFLIKDLCDTLLSQMPCKPKESISKEYTIENWLNDPKDGKNHYKHVGQLTPYGLCTYETEGPKTELEEDQIYNPIKSLADHFKKTEGPKDTQNKTDWSVMPWDTLEEVCKIFEYGKDKYGAPFTYRKGIKFSKLYAAILRHLFAWWKGKDNDNESGYKHLAHICANCMMLMSMDDKKEFDDRDKL